MDASGIKSIALELGFARVGIASAEPLHNTQALRRWLVQGMNAGMGYMTANLPLRFCPSLLVDGAKSVIVLAVPYAPAVETPTASSHGVIARYARGRDYHKVLKDRCRKLMDRIRGIEPGFAGRAFVDAAPVMERSLAVLAGLGAIGKNGCLIVPGLGSYVLLCEIICNLPLQPDVPLPVGSVCSGCGQCVASCPTGALQPDGLVDCSRCISYLTIEHKGGIDARLHKALGNRIFGCDACQECCPHNSALPAGDAKLLGGGVNSISARDVLEWDEPKWDAATRGRAIRRASLEMWQRNAAIVAANAAD